MLLLGVGVVWAGYTLVYFGYESLQGPGVGLLDLVIPGRFKGFTQAAGGGSQPGPSGQSGFGPGGRAGGGGGGGGGGSF